MADKRLVEDMSALQWWGLGIIMAIIAIIPFIGWLTVISITLYWAFSDEYKNHVLKNYARGNLIWLLIGVIFFLVIGSSAGIAALFS